MKQPQTTKPPKILCAYHQVSIWFTQSFLFKTSSYSDRSLDLSIGEAGVENLLCNSCSLSTDEPGQNVLASSTCFKIGHELIKSIYKHCTSLQNGAHILRKEPPLSLWKKAHLPSPLWNSWHMKRKKDFWMSLLILKLLEGKRNCILRLWKTSREACSLSLRTNLVTTVVKREVSTELAGRSGGEAGREVLNRITVILYWLKMVSFSKSLGPFSIAQWNHWKLSRHFQRTLG